MGPNISSFNYTLDVKHSNLLYNVSIAFRTNDSKFDDNGYSDFSSVTFITKASIPDRPPSTDLGSFHLVNSAKCEVDIFWTELNEDEYNGEDLTYPIEIYRNGVEVEDKMAKISFIKSSARFDGICLHDEYEFRIYSKNEVGPSTSYSSIIIPRNNDLIDAPEPTSKLLSNRVYTLVWKRPLDVQHLESYTIFWCEPLDEQHTLCSTSIKSIIVSADKLNYTYNNNFEESSKIFAISSNTRNSRSGMAWFPCSASNVSDMTKFPAHSEVLSESSIKISWTLKCDTTLALKGFNITYWPAEYSNVNNSSGKTIIYSDLIK